MFNKIDLYFGISKSGSSFTKEIQGGIVAYLSMAYIIFVNPVILGDAGMNQDAVFAATVLAAALSTLIMGIYARFPLALASCMSLNSFFTYSVVLGSGLSWQEGLACVFLSSIVFIFISVIGLRMRILKAIPESIKNAGSVGLGLFIAFIGLKNAGILVSDDNIIVSMGSLANPGAIIAVSGIIALAYFLVKKNNNAVFLSMMVALVVGLIINVLYQNNIISVDERLVATIPTLPKNIIVSPFKPVHAMIDNTFLIAFKNIPNVISISGISIIFTFMFLDFFGTATTLSAATSQTKGLDIDDSENTKIYLADAWGTFFGSLLGTSNISTYVESVSGVIAGARTGLMAVVVAILFISSLLLYPFLSLFTSGVTASALVAIGLFMFKNITSINWQDNWEITIPSFFVIILMPLTGSISLGLTIGFFLYTILMVIAGRSKEIDRYLYAIFIVSVIYIISEVL